MRKRFFFTVVKYSVLFAFYSFFNSIADVFIDVAPVFKRALKHWLGNIFLQVPNNV